MSRKYRAKFCREIKRDLALDDKVFRALRRSTKGAAFGNRSLLKKAGENFMFLQPLLQPPRSVKFFLCLLSFFTKKKVRDKVPEILRGEGGMIEVAQTVDRLGQKGYRLFPGPGQ